MTMKKTIYALAVAIAYATAVNAQEPLPAEWHLDECIKYAQEHGFAGVDLGNVTIPERTMVFAIAVVTTGPMLCVFAVFQKYFVRGLTTGAVKG